MNFLEADLKFCFISIVTSQDSRSIPVDILKHGGSVKHCFVFSVSGQLNATDMKLWMGLNRLEKDAGWQWSDGAPLAFVNWRAST